MAQTQTALYNLALSAANARKTVSLPTENSREAEMCNLWYEPIRRHIFRAAHWPSLKRFARLGLLAERDPAEDWVIADPEPGYVFAYGLPQDCAAARYLTTFQRFSSGFYRNESRSALFTDVEDAILVYTADNTNPSQWSSDLYLAVAYGMAAHIIMPLTGKNDRTQLMIAQANAVIDQCRTSTANEHQFRFDSLPDWIQARGFQGGASVERFVAPYGEYLQMMGAPVV